jgi:cation diffusion facilitator family transporter
MQQRYKEVKKVTLIGAAANIFLAVVKIIFGWLGHSSALIADGVHSFSDLLTDALVLIAAKYGAQTADDDHPYGHARYETFASFLLSIFLMVVGGAIGWHGIAQLFTEQNIMPPDTYVIWFAALSVIVNEIIYRYTLRVGKRIQSDLLIANAIHSRSDAASSLVVLIGVAGSLLGYVFLDEVAAVIVAILIIKMGIGIAWENVKELVDTALDPEQIEKIKQVIMQVPGVQSVHELRTRRMAGKGLLDVHIIVNPYLTVSEGHHIAEHVIWNLKQKIDVLQDVVVHIDSENDENYSSTSKLPMRMKLVPELQNHWKNLPGYQQIIDIRLHYLAGKIDLEVVLPVDFATQYDTTQLQKQYYAALMSMNNIASLTLLFK